MNHPPATLQAIADRNRAPIYARCSFGEDGEPYWSYQDHPPTTGFWLGWVVVSPRREEK